MSSHDTVLHRRIRNFIQLTEMHAALCKQLDETQSSLAKDLGKRKIAISYGESGKVIESDGKNLVTIIENQIEIVL